jgi:hypothetical protein
MAPIARKTLPCLKYFVNRSVCLQQYREALQLCYTFEDKDTREYTIDMMRHEFEPLRKYRQSFQQDEEV